MRDGCPVAVQGGHGKEYQFETGAVINWLRDKEKNRGGSLDEIKKRKAEADAQLAGLKAGKEAGLFVEIDEVIREVANDYVNIKTRMMQLPKRLPPILMGETSERMAQIIGEEIESIFKEVKNRFIIECGGIEAAADRGNQLSNATNKTNSK
jgi:phage terminase Nu1 subunit (DNA packaging protein)